MDAKHLFDSEKYFSEMVAANRLAAEHGFKFCTCSGIESLQGPLEQFRRQNAFVCLDDTNDGAMFMGRGGGWYKRRTFTVFILHRYSMQRETDRIEKLTVCRSLFRQMMSKMLVDADDMQNELIYLGVGNVLSREFGQYFMNGCTGLYFMVDVDEPIDLTYDNSEWLS